MSYTKGPWELSKLDYLTNDGQRPVMAPSAEQGRVRVALVDAQVEFKRGKGWQSVCDQREANARLIAAAPEMLEALKRIAESNPSEGLFDLCAAVIRKAETGR